MTLNDFYQFESYLNEKMTLNDSAAPLRIGSASSFWLPESSACGSAAAAFTDCCWVTLRRNDIRYDERDHRPRNLRIMSKERRLRRLRPGMGSVKRIHLYVT